MSKSRYIAIGPGRIDQKHVEGMGKAVFLHDFLVDHQTDADGRVNYGKPISYEWILRRFPGAKRRTLERWMARLVEGGYISLQLYGPFGFVIRILNQKKWPDRRQMPLFPAPQPVCINSGKAANQSVESKSTSAISGGARYATSGGDEGCVSIYLKRKEQE